MIRCPVCESGRIVVVISPNPRAFCARCGSKWIQEGSYQRAVRRVPFRLVRDRRAASAP